MEPEIPHMEMRLLEPLEGKHIQYPSPVAQIQLPVSKKSPI